MPRRQRCAKRLLITSSALTMDDPGLQARPNWRSILLFYFLACAFAWPFFWWRDVHTQSWNASSIPPEIRDLTWGPAAAAFLVVYFYPESRSRTVSLFGTSVGRSISCFMMPILFAWLAVAVEQRHFANKIIYYLIVGGISIFGEEKGWRGFLQDQLLPSRPRARLSAALVNVGGVALHFSLQGNVARGCGPLIVARAACDRIDPSCWDSSRNGRAHCCLPLRSMEWVDIMVDSGDRGLFWSGIAWHTYLDLVSLDLAQA